MFYLNIAVKSILTRRRQYKSLFAVCAVGVCLMLTALMITDGMIKSMNEKAMIYYGGKFQFLGGHEYNFPKKYADEEIQMLENILPENAVASARYCHDAGGGERWNFNGVDVRQRVIMGVDFEREKEIFSTMSFLAGSADPAGVESSVILSEPIAKKLGCNVGDVITLLVYAADGYINTSDFQLIGIFKDTSVFGMYTSYVNYDSLMNVLNFSEGNLVNRISINYANKAPSAVETLRLQKALEEKVDMMPLGMRKDDFYELNRNHGDRRYALISLESNVSNLDLLMMALRLIITAIIILLVVIISIGISSTFRVIIIKRTTENGTFRALGMKPSGIMLLFVTEVFVLLVSGCILGFACAAVLARFASGFDLSFISGFDLFLTGSHLAPVCNFAKIGGLILVIFVTTIGSVLFTLRKLVHVSPVGALAATV